MKKSIRKIIFSTGTALLSCATVASVIVSTACSSSNSNVNNNSYLSTLNSKSSDFVYKYDKKIFSTLDDLATYYINKNPDSVTSDFYLGDVNSSILDPSTSMLDINDFKPYEPSRLHPVYLNALNMTTHDYNAAKNTYANRGLIDYKYYDFNGNIFDSYEEARQSIINSKESMGVLFYNNLEVSPTSEPIKFNPLSKKDLLKFKKIAFQNAATTFSGTKKTNFDLKIYSGNSESEFKNIIDGEFIHKIIVEAINHYFETKMKLLSNSRFDITLSLIDDGGGIYCNYMFSDFWTKDSSNIKLLDSKRMSFKNVSFNDIDKFNCFLNRSEFQKWFNITNRHRPHLYGNYMAEEAKTNNFLNTSFKIKHIGDNQGDAWPLYSSDYKILEHGDAKGRNFLSFDVNIKIRNNANRESFETQFRNIIKTYISNLESQSNSLVGKIRHGIFDQVLNNLLENDWKFDIDSLYWEGFKYSGQANMNELRTIKSNVVFDNWFLKGWTAESEKHKPLAISSDNGLYNDCEKLKKLKYKENIISKEKINNLIIKNLFDKDKLNFVIEYNESPLFSFGINNDFLNLNLINPDDDRYMSYIKREISNIFNNISLENSNNDFFNSFKNVSQSFSKENGEKVLNDSNLFSFEESSNKLKFNYTGDGQFNSDLEIFPELKNNKEISYQINSLVKVYNNLVENLSDYDNSSELISNQFVDPKDIVVLYKNDTPTTMNYREFLSGDYNVVANLIDNKINLVNSKSELNDLIVNTTNIQPAKVVVVYDLLNNIINPGIELTEEQKLLTTSDAIFDSSNTIVDNILRTKLVPRDEKNIYYKDDDGEYHKVRNKVNEIYTLNIDGNTYYFPSHDKLMIQLRKYLATQAERIVYE